MRRCHQLEQPLHPSCPQRLVVILEHSLKRLGGAPLRVRRDQRLDAVEGEGELDVGRLLGPERPIVVEDGDALLRRHEFRAGFSGNPRDKIQD